MVHFEHKWWHKIGLLLISTLFIGFLSVLYYAALFAPPEDQSQWVPLIGLIVFFSVSIYFYLKSLKNIAHSIKAELEGVRVQSAFLNKSLFIEWAEIVELSPGSSWSGFGFIKTQNEKVTFCSWGTESDELYEFMYKKCEEENV